jgi:hypothetical protein
VGRRYRSRVHDRSRSRARCAAVRRYLPLNADEAALCVAVESAKGRHCDLDQALLEFRAAALCDKRDRERLFSRIVDKICGRPMLTGRALKMQQALYGDG